MEGILPISKGRDLEMVSRKAGLGAHVKARRPGAWLSRCTHDSGRTRVRQHCMRATWNLCRQVTALIFVSRHQFLCRDTVEVRTGLALGRDMISMLWQGQPLGCRDTAFGVAIEKPHCGLKWCRDTRP